MARLCALQLIATIAACGSPTTTAAPKPIAIDAGIDAASADDPAMAEVLAWLTQQRAAACACTDAACAEQVDALGFDWSFAHQALLAAARPSPSQDAAARAAIEATEACNERWHHAAP